MIKKIDAASLIHPRNVDIDCSVLKLSKYIYDSMKTYFDNFHYTKDG
jgi:hypothetical protein